MQSFRTHIPLRRPEEHIELYTPVLALGSCFAEEMGNKLRSHKFKAEINPCGILFNPISIFSTIKMALMGERIDVDSPLFVKDGSYWQHYLFHSKLGDIDKQVVVRRINQSLDSIQNHWHQGATVIITFGSAYGYRELATNNIVGNCHKQPKEFFQKDLISVETIVESFKNLIPLANSSPRLILSVSPVRHIKDGMVENTKSKATLLLACHQIVESIQRCQYFPALELMMDDLRDYRFYNQDMIHPSTTAIDYIWQHFVDNEISPDGGVHIKKFKKLLDSLNHKPRHPGTPEHRKFLEDLLAKLDEFPNIELSQEKNKIKSELVLCGSRSR